MNTDIELPEDYVPFATLNLCSNIATNYRIPIRAGNHAALLIGRGEIPLIWIAQANPNNPTKWNFLVQANRALHPKIKVRPDKTDSAVQVRADSDILVKVKAENADSAVVSYIDLRPVGLNIHGDWTALFVGNNQLSGNRFDNVANLIAIGE
jgi:hypothetical protein